MIKSDKISSFFKKSGPEITFLTIYDLFGEYDVKKEKTPLRGMRLRAGTRPSLGKKNHLIILSNLIYLIPILLIPH